MAISPSRTDTVGYTVVIFLFILCMLLCGLILSAGFNWPGVSLTFGLAIILQCLTGIIFSLRALI